MGRGPYGGSSFELIVREAEIVRASQHWQISTFSPQIWEPFARWVARTHSKDAAVMYRDSGYATARLTAESIEELEAALDEYYRLCGWDQTTGMPTRGKLHELDLGWMAS